MIIQKLIRRFCLFTWRFWETLGFHIVPNHFYWPIQDSRKLAEYDFESKFPLHGMKMDTDSVKERVCSLGAYRNEYKELHYDSGYTSNGDGAILYAMIRQLKPKKVIEVGSGHSTVVIHGALRKNTQEDQIAREIISIEPYPKQVLRDLVANSNVVLQEKRVEHVEPSFFQQLEQGDVLFIDTSHVVDIGNDVHFLYLKVLPQIPVGVVVHIHDIRFPYEYPKEWVIGARKYWTEQYLLHMFMAFNDSFEVVLASNFLCQEDRRLMASNFHALSESGRGWPGSFWIRRTK